MAPGHVPAPSGLSPKPSSISQQPVSFSFLIPDSQTGKFAHKLSILRVEVQVTRVCSVPFLEETRLRAVQGLPTGEAAEGTAVRGQGLEEAGGRSHLRCWAGANEGAAGGLAPREWN